MTAADSPPPEPDTSAPTPVKSSPKWLTLAIASGATAAFNGVFAKLTTTAQTHTLVESISHMLGLAESSRFIEILVRAGFFGCNLLCNALMWILFTRALTASNSTTRVSILNTAANFMMTAVLGMLIFSEHLPLGWWGGAILLVSGSVIVGAREGANKEEAGVVVTDHLAGETVPMGSGLDGLNANTSEPYADETDDSEDEGVQKYRDDVDTSKNTIT